jgi:peptidoglycan hydrolase CwlO-like protein
MTTIMKRRKIFFLSLIAFFVVANFWLHGKRSMAAEDAGDLQSKIDKYQNQKEQVQQQLDSAQGNLAKNQSQISVTKSLIQKTESELTRTEKELSSLENKLELDKTMLTSYIQQAYYVDQEIGLDLSMNDLDISENSQDFDQIVGVKEKIVAMIGEVNQTKGEIENTKNELADKKEDHEKLLTIKQGEQYEIKEDIQEAQSSLSELNAKINKLRGELSSLLGSSVSFNNIIDAAAFAQKVTGVRKDYLLGVLVVESNLGRFTGGCNFKESRMSGTRAETFKGICKELKYDYTKMKVSCPPSGYKGTGGAMGVAQFMPDTWAGYKSSIASVTGHKPPDPWNLTDGVVAMALKLSKVDGVTSHKRSAEAKAYCVYLAGGNWAAYCDSKGVNYGEKVLYWADNYERLMK